MTTETTSAAPSQVLANLRHLYANLWNGEVRDTASAKRIAEGLLSPAIAELERTQPTGVGVPGWQWVPVEPTQAMLDAVVTTMDDFLLGKEAERQYREDWAAMLAASPPPPVPQTVAREPLSDVEALQILLDMDEHIGGFCGGAHTAGQTASEAVRFIIDRLSALGIVATQKGDKHE